MFIILNVMCIVSCVMICWKSLWMKSELILVLVVLYVWFEKSYKGYIEELGDEECYFFFMDFFYYDFFVLLIKLKNFELGIDLFEGFIVSLIYWLVEGDLLFGVLNLRYELILVLCYVGGYIGLGICFFF